jgi:type II secretory pathway pseudopilin PulG
MAEIVISTVIVGVMTVAALESVGMVFRTQRLSADRLAAHGLAQELLAEVLAMPYEDPQSPGGGIGLDSGESSGTRSTFDDVDDYDDWSSSIRRKDGVAVSGYTGWQQAVQVAYASLTDPVTDAGSDLGLKRVTVTVTGPDGKVTTVVGLRARRGSLEQPQGLAASAVSWLGASLRVQGSPRDARSGVAPTNPATDAN